MNLSKKSSAAESPKKHEIMKVTNTDLRLLARAHKKSLKRIFFLRGYDLARCVPLALVFGSFPFAP